MSQQIQSYEGQIRWLRDKLRKCQQWRHCKIVRQEHYDVVHSIIGRNGKQQVWYFMKRDYRKQIYSSVEAQCNDIEYQIDSLQRKIEQARQSPSSNVEN